MATLTWGLTQEQANEAEEGRMDVEDARHLKMRSWQETDFFFFILGNDLLLMKG